MVTVLHIIESLSDYGGTPRKLLYLTRHLDSSVCRQIFLCYLPSALKDEFKRHGAVVECLDNTSPAAIIPSATRLTRKYGVDAICTHFTRPLVAGYATALVTGLPVIHNEHSSASYRRGAGRILARLILPRVQSVTCNSGYTLDSVRKEFGAPQDKLIVLHNPVEERVCEASRDDVRKWLGLSSDDLVIGHVGGMIPQRDQVTLIRAFALVKAQHPNARLVMIGDGASRGELESLAARLGLESAVKFVGYTDRVGDCLRAMDLYVNPTLDEGFGIAVVEAMLAGLPVVLSDRGAHPELVDDGVSGLLYPGGDSATLARRLDRLAGDPGERARMGESARVRASAHFHPKRYAEEYFRHVKTIVETFRMSKPATGSKGRQWTAPF